MAVNFYIPAGYAGCYDGNTLHHCHKELVHTATSTLPSWREISWECLGGVLSCVCCWLVFSSPSVVLCLFSGLLLCSFASSCLFWVVAWFALYLSFFRR